MSLSESAVNDASLSMYSSSSCHPGTAHLRRGRTYEAANEFEWARKLMPGHPDPRMNLAITLESVGRVDEALAAYDSALEVYPNHLPTIQALAKLQLRRNCTDERTAEFLREIALRGEDATWREWAQMQLSRIDTARDVAPSAPAAR
jgi:Flp pilus assembly protein TadD